MAARFPILTLETLRNRVLRRPFVLFTVAGLVVVEIVLLRPTSLEHAAAETGGRGLIPRSEVLGYFVPDEPPLAPGIPFREVPSYNLLSFHFLSSKAGAKQWKILANRAHMYEEQKIVHAVEVEAFLFDTKGMEEKITHIVAREAKYRTGNRELELFGRVRATFPDGFVVESEYMHYDPKKKVVTIPRQYPVRGHGQPDPARILRFASRGLRFGIASDLAELPESADVTLVRKGLAKDGFNAMPENTRIWSDRAVLNRAIMTAHFEMYPHRGPEDRFVKVEQPQLRLRARTVDVNYDDLERRMHYMVARTDVAIKEEYEPGEPVRYATCGQADFDAKVNKIVLTQLPQVYQDSDTITGEVITIYRDTDTVEVEQSNAFSEGKQDS